MKDFETQAENFKKITEIAGQKEKVTPLPVPHQFERENSNEDEWNTKQLENKRLLDDNQ